MSVSAIFDGSAPGDDTVVIRCRHRVTRSAASASANDGVALRGYQGSVGHDGVVP